MSSYWSSSPASRHHVPYQDTQDPSIHQQEVLFARENRYVQYLLVKQASKELSGLINKTPEYESACYPVPTFMEFI